MMSNNKFHKILSDTITLPLLPANNFKETDTTYYAVLEKNYIPVTSDVICIYKPEWIIDYKFEKDENTNEYNKLIITSISDNDTEKLRSDIMEFTVSNDVNSLMPINHIYAKVSQAPLENIEVMLEFIPTENQTQLHIDGGTISGDEQEIHIKYWAVLNKRNQSNVTLLLNGKSLNTDKIKSLKINSSDNTVELIYLIEENIDIEKTLSFKAKYKTQYNSSDITRTITQKCNTYNITLSIDNQNVDFNGGNRILTYKCTYTDGINDDKKDVKDNLYLQFSYKEDQNELKYNVIKTVYDNDSHDFKTTINVDNNYTFEPQYLNVKVIYNNKIESNTIEIIQGNPTIKLQYYVEYLNRNISEQPSIENKIYEVSAFGETIRLHYYGIIVIENDKKESIKITSVTNTKNNISTTYTIDTSIDNIQYNNVTLNNDEYILDINFDRNESKSITKNIRFDFCNLFTSCTLTQGVLSIELKVNQDKSSNIIGGIPEYNNIILTFRAYDTEKDITVEDVNLYSIVCDNNDVDLNNIQYEIITYTDDKAISNNYIVVSNIRCKNIYDKKEDRELNFTISYNNINVDWKVTQKSVIYGCEIKPTTNYVSGLGDDNFEITCIGIIYNGLIFKNGTLDKDNDKHIELPINNDGLTPNNFNPSNIINNIRNKKCSNKTQTIIKVEPLSRSENDNTVTEKDKEFSINIQYKDVTATCKIKRLYLQLYIELYKDATYSNMIDDLNNLYISPFIDNKLYYKCYLCEINEDKKPLKVDVSSYPVKECTIMSTIDTNNYSNSVDVPTYVDTVPTYNSNDYTYRGNIIIHRYIVSNKVTYAFKYIQGYSVDENNENLKLYKTVNIYKPKIQTCIDNDQNPRDTTYIQYRAKDSSYNDDKSILYIGNSENGISSKGYELTLYYRVVFKIVFQDDVNYNYIYGDNYRTYIDVDRTHFTGFLNNDNITIDKDSFSNAEETTQYDNSTYLKITFNVNKNDTLGTRDIVKYINYNFLGDTIDGIQWPYNNGNKFYSNIPNDYNNIHIYQNGASFNISAFFDNNNSGIITDNRTKITYNAYEQLNQNLHVKILLNDELQPTYSNQFNVSNDKYYENFKISDGIENKDLNTYKSEYNLNALYIESDNTEYSIQYTYKNGEDFKYSNVLTIKRTSFGKDDNCVLNVTIDKDSVSNNDETVKITFWLTYESKIIDLGKDAIQNFIYNLAIDNDTIIALSPGKENFVVIYDNDTLKYSFDYIIDANPTVNEKVYKFTVGFGEKSKYVICTQGCSSYKLIATIDPVGLLAPLNPSNIIIKCHIEKDGNGDYFQNVQTDKFKIEYLNEPETGSKLTLLSTPPFVQPGEYGQEYKVADNKNADSIIYRFECSYILDSKTYTAEVSISQSGALFDVSIYDSETDQSKQNIVNPVGETKTITYFGILNGEHVIEENITFINETTGNGLNFMSEEGNVIIDTENKILSRKYRFNLNTTASTITYKFTAKYQDKSISIIFTQKPGEITLILKNEPDPIPKSGGQCKIIYYGYVGSDSTKTENHITTDLTLNESTEVDGFMSYNPTKESGPTVNNYQMEYVFSVPARVEDINIDKLFKRNWSVTYKNGDIEKSINKDIIQNGDSDFFPSFDIFGLVYEWDGGKDLDTATLLTRSDNGSLIINESNVDICQNSFGYKQDNNLIYSNVYNYIAFSGDNRNGCGYESIAINFRKLLVDFQLSNLNITLNFDIWMTWYSGRWDGNVNIKFVRYNDITFKTDNTGNIQFYSGIFNPQKSFLYLLNDDINQLDTTNSSIKITEKTTYVDSKGQPNLYQKTYAKVGSLKYNTMQKTAILSIDSSANSSIRASIKNSRVELNIRDFYKDICYDSEYSLNNIISTNSSIQNGVYINMEAFYRDTSVSTPVQKDLIYVDCSIYKIYLYDSSSYSNTYTPTSILPETHTYYKEILSKDLYAPTNTNTNTFQIPALDLNNIKLPAPTFYNNKTYYGLDFFMIRYSYKYNNIPDKAYEDFYLIKTININNKI